MKSVKLISLAIAMLFCVIAFGQQDSIKRSIPVQPIVALGKEIEKNEPKKDRLYVLDGKIIDYSELKKINPETIKSVDILETNNKSFACNGGEKTLIIIRMKKLSKRELRKLKKKDS